jgi:hypothetical protein
LFEFVDFDERVFKIFYEGDDYNEEDDEHIYELIIF